MAYDKNKDYTTLIDDAVKAGDYYSAAEYEQQRNEKISSEGLDYTPTNRFSGWLDTTDYSQILNDQMSGGASAEEVAKTLKSRTQKASGTEGLNQYAYDDTYDRAMDYILNNNAASREFSYETAPEWASKYSQQIDELVNKLLNREQFSYDYRDDPTYRQYRESYAREGDRAMRDTMAEASAQTGGLASSYAAGAANQANNYYMSQLADKIPELEQQAYDRYMDELNLSLSDINLLQGLDNTDYGRYQDALNQFNTDRAFEYGRYSDDRAYNRQDKEDAYDLAIAMIKAGATPSADVLRKAGISQADADALYGSVTAGSYSGSGSGGRGGSTGTGSTGTDGGLESLYADMRSSGMPEAYLAAYYKKYGVAYSQISNILKGYYTWADGQAPQQDAGTGAEPDESVKNQNGRSWVYVPGYGRLSWQELQKMVDRGEVKETYNQSTGKYTYAKAR